MSYFLQVEIPKILYSGQKLNKAVTNNIMAIASNMMPGKPEMIFKEKRVHIATAIMTLPALSANPTFLGIFTSIKNEIYSE